MLMRLRNGLSWKAIRGGWRGFWPSVALVFVVVVLRNTGTLDERVAGVLLACGIPISAVLFIVGSAGVPRSHRQWFLVGCAGLVTLLASIIPGLDGILPGPRRAGGDAQAVGDSVALPSGMHGPVRVLVHAQLPASGNQFIGVSISGATKPFEARFGRTVLHRHGARRKYHTAAHGPEFRYFDAVIPVGAQRLHVDKLVGEPEGRIRIDIYDPKLPLWAVLGVDLFALVVVVLAGSCGVPLRANAADAAGLALGFGFALSYSATPGFAVGPAFAALLSGAPVGAAVGASLAWIGARWMPALSALATTDERRTGAKRARSSRGRPTGRRRFRSRRPSTSRTFI